MEKKDSIFAGLNPVPPPSFAQGPVPSPRPAAQDQDVAALKQKIDAMEKNIVGQLEKKMGEYLKPSAPPPPPPGASRAQEMTVQSLLARIGELDKRLEEFTRSAMVSSVQMKNIEESKIGARREIEELLKVVREQQKYSELDRQMHDQLEKSWSRVEELEKKLMDFYTAISKKPAEMAADSCKIMEAALEQRLSPFESSFKAVTARLDAVPDVVLGVETRVREFSASVDARLTGFASDIRQLHIEAFAGKEQVQDIIAEIKKDVLSSVREAFAEAGAALIKHVDASALDERERVDVFSKLVIGHIDGLAMLSRDGGVKLDALEAGVKSENARTRDELERALRERIAAAAADARAENAGQLKKVTEIYGLSVSNLSAISAVSENIAAVEERLSGVLAGLKAFVKGTASINMGSILGVSGAMMRKSFESAEMSIAELENAALALAKAKAEIETNLKKIRSGPGA
ncbi:MAG: hypothetical protein WCW52_01545 [Elusimicrobiales bacterium]|jgi:hypothetical protein